MNATTSEFYMRYLEIYMRYLSPTSKNQHCWGAFGSNLEFINARPEFYMLHLDS